MGFVWMRKIFDKIFGIVRCKYGINLSSPRFNQCAECSGKNYCKFGESLK